MKRKLFKKFLLLLLTTLCVFLIFSKINHSVKLKYEKEELQSYGVGQPIDFNGDNINIYTSGNERSDDTIVFMHGLGMGDTTVSARPLLKKFEDKYKICIVDRYGNGLSDDTDKPQTIDNVIEEYREVLKKSNQKSPYILFAHSVSGIYATYYAEKYPSEVKSIVYIDADPAEVYVKEGKLNTSQLIINKVQNIFTSLGLQRILSSKDALLGDTKNQVFSDAENNMRELLMYQNTYSKATCSEFKLYYDNAKTVLDNDINLNIPQIYISAVNTEGDYYDDVYSKVLEKRFNNDTQKIQDKIDTENNIVNTKIEYMQNRKNVDTVKISGPHTLYEYKIDEMYNVISDFFNKYNIK